MIYGISYEIITTIISLIFLTITQIILIQNGKADQALKIEKRKENLINKLIKKRDKNANKALEIDKKIVEISNKKE